MYGIQQLLNGDVSLLHNMTSIPTFDAASNGKNAGSGNLTVAHTCTGTNLCLVVMGKVDTGNTISCTYAGVSMTKLRTVTHSALYDLVSFYLVNPATWANNIVLSVTGSHQLELCAGSYTWVAQSAPITNLDSGLVTASGSTASETSASTSPANQKIVVGLWYSSYSVSSPSCAPASSGTNRTENSLSNNNGLFFFDINAATTTTYTVGGTLSGGGSWSMELNYLSLVPYSAPINGNFLSFM